MEKIRLGILRGGDNEFYNSSLERGGSFMRYLHEKFADFVVGVDIFVDKENIWHINGKAIEPTNLMHRVDFVWNFTHPSFSAFLNTLQIQNITENIFANGFIDSRDILKNLIKENLLHNHVYIPRHLLLPSYQKDIDGDFDLFIHKKTKEVFNKFASPWIVSIYPKSTDHSPVVVKTLEELFLILEEYFSLNKSILVEEIAFGKEGVLYMLGHFRNKNNYIFPLMDNFSTKEKEYIYDISSKIFELFKFTHFMKISLQLNNKNKIHIKEISFNNFLLEEGDFDEALGLVFVKKEEILLSLLGIK